MPQITDVQTICNKLRTGNAQNTLWQICITYELQTLIRCLDCLLLLHTKTVLWIVHYFWRSCFVCCSVWVTVMRTMLIQSARLSSSSSLTVFGKWPDRSVSNSDYTLIFHFYAQQLWWSNPCVHGSVIDILEPPFSTNYQFCCPNCSSHQLLSLMSCSWSLCWIISTAAFLVLSFITVNRKGQPRFAPFFFKPSIMVV